jgi:23S rRNA (adenine1618-N6)-methyltransferase
MNYVSTDLIGIFVHGIDVEDVAIDFPELNKFFRFSKTKAMARFFDWDDRDALIAFTRAVLQRYFKLDVHFERSHLVPGITLRLKYVQVLETLVGTNSLDRDVNSSSVTHHGIDIGTGANVIYPLLFKRIHPALQMIGTDIDRSAVTLAAQNWQRNFASIAAKPESIQTGNRVLLDGLDLRFVETRASAPTPLLDSVLKEDERVLFCMCNPPFYDSVDAKQRRGKRTFVATASEVSTTGGESALARQLVDESLVLRARVRLYSIMLGLMRDVAPLLAYIAAQGASISDSGSAPLAQGNVERAVVWWRVNA